MMARILLVEDDVSVRSAVARLLGGDYLLVEAGSLREAREKLAEGRVDLVLLDVGLPDGQGMSLCAHMKDSDALKDVPIVFLTGNDAVDELVLAFSAGADDYVLKPFEGRELRARIKARLRGVQSRKPEDVVAVGNLRLSVPLQRAFLAEPNETALALSPLEFKMLLYFSRHEEHVLARDQIMTAVWGENSFFLDRTIDKHISELRKKLAGCTHSIETVRGSGYRFARPARRKAA